MTVKKESIISKRRIQASVGMKLTAAQKQTKSGEYGGSTRGDNPYCVKRIDLWERLK